MTSMLQYRTDWTYKGLSAARTEALREAPTFPEVVRRIVEKADPASIKFCIDTGRLEPVTGAPRPIFYLSVGKELADAFFNGTTGYRAQYYHSVESGEAANQCALSALEPYLLACAEQYGFRCADPNNSGQVLEMTESEIAASLRLPSAKIWGDESSTDLSVIVRLDQDPSPQICAPRWMMAADAGEQKARKGIKAPSLSTLKFHGGFLNDGVERVPADKANRSEQIYKFGFT